MPKKSFLFIFCLLLVCGCAGAGLSTKVQMSDDIMIPPSADKTIFIETHNTSIAPLDNLGNLLSERFAQQGFVVLSDIKQAHYYLQLDVVEFGYFNETTQMPIVPYIGVGVGTGWGPVGIGMGVGIGTILGSLFDDQRSHYTMAAYVRIEEQVAGAESIMHESSLVSGASQDDINFEQGYTFTRDAMIEKIMALFADK